MRNEVSAAHFVFARHSLLGRSGEAVKEMARTRVAKPGLLKRFDHLCNLQSAGNSPGPEVYIVTDVLGQLPSNDDVSELQSAARLHHSIQLGEERRLV